MASLKQIKARVKLVDGYFTLETVVEQRKRINLCDQCGLGARCSIRSTVAKLNKEGVVILPVKTCKEFRHRIPFQSERGLIKDRVNTFRMGAAWSGRIDPGNIVLLTNSKTGAVYGEAEVIEKHVGSFEEMATAHALNNHMLIDSGEADPVEAMYTILQKSYGPLYVSRDKQVSVIYWKWLGHGAEQEGEALQR